MRRIAIAIVDDDDDDAGTTNAMLTRFAGNTADREAMQCLVSRFSDGPALLAAYDDPARKPFDIIFLDIEMPGINGLETARMLRMRDSRAILVFTTKMAQYATAGYDVNAIGYLVKPIRYPGFALNMRKAMRILENRRGISITIQSDSHLRLLNSEDIRYVEVEGHSLLYHTGQGIWRDWGTLKAAAETLIPCHFAVSNRYCLVNLEWVTAFDGQTVTVDGEQLTVSRSRRKSLLEALTRYYGVNGPLKA